MLMIPLPPEETQKSLFGLLCTGVVEHAEGPPKPAPPRAAPASRPAPAAPQPPPAAAPPSAAASPASPPRPAPPAAAPPSPPPPSVPPAAAAPSASAQPVAPPAATPPAPAVGPAPAAPAGSPAAEERRREILDAFDHLKTRTHYEVLGIPTTATEAQVKEAYFKLARRFHPDSHHDPSLGDLRNKLEAVFIGLGEAYEVLKSARARAHYDEGLGRRTAPGAPAAASGTAGPAVVGPAAYGDPEAERRVAEEAIRRANKAMEKEQYWDAIQLLEPAIDALTGRAHVRARVILATAYLKNPKWVKRGEEVFQTVIRDDPQNVDALLALARIYKAQGMRTRSISMFRKVLQAQPDNEEAKAEVPPESSPDEPPPAGGFIKKLFGKG
jgi:hypothetical protein